MEVRFLAALAVPAALLIAQEPGEQRVNPRDGARYVYAPPGSFLMGCSSGDSQCEGNERPAHRVTLTRGFWISATEVRQDQYQRIMRSNPSRWRGADHPVERVTWDEARQYCEKVGMRLPTEAEWEYAARAGDTRARYGAIEAIARYGAKNGTQPVGSKPSNAWGMHDMLGNVWEWVQDWYGAAPYDSAPATDPKGPPSGAARVFRGGSWLLDPQFVRASMRGWGKPADRFNDQGFRCNGNSLDY